MGDVCNDYTLLPRQMQEEEVEEYGRNRLSLNTFIAMLPLLQKAASPLAIGR